MRNIDLIREVTSAAANQWPSVLAGLSIEVPDSPRRHAACPACGGVDRFRFDDNGRGSHFCNQCGAGDGLDLIAKVRCCDITTAARMVADVLDIDYRTAKVPESASQRKSLPAAKVLKSTLEQNQGVAFADSYRDLGQKVTFAESQYLQHKGLDGFTFSILPDGRLLLPLRNASGDVVAAQTISPSGEKRLIAGSSKKGSYYAVNAVEAPQSILIAEGLATALSVHLMRPEALTVAAIDAGNLLPVAQVLRVSNTDAQIIIAADNDFAEGAKNVGIEAAEKAALSVAGWVSAPLTEKKADWDDYRQENGLEAAAKAFASAMYQPQGENMTTQLRAIDGGKKNRRTASCDISQMAASQKAKLLSARWEKLSVNPESGSVYSYGAGVWKKLSDSEIERVMVSIFEEHEAHYTEKGIKSVVATMKLQLQPSADQRTDLIGFKNGVYDLNTLTFSAHSPDNWLMNHNGIDYTPPAQGESLAEHAPHFTRWLKHASNGDHDKGDRIKAALFMVLAKRHDWQLFIEVTGEGGSGKSVFSSIATTLAGEHNTASGSMSTLDLARGRAQFVGKSLIIMPDQTRYVGEGAGIKAITGGDPVEIDGKYEKQFTTVLNAVVLATNNEPMTFTERNGGISRRRVIFTFNNPVSEADKDPELTAKIQREVPVIIRHLLKIFSDQNKAKTLLTEQRDSLEALGVKRGTDPVIDMCAALFFMSEPKGLMMGGGTWTGQPEPRTYLYHLYLSFLEYHGMGKPLSVERFSRAMKNAAKEYRSQYLTRKVRGRTQTNISIMELAEEFIPRAYGIDIPDTP